MNKKEINQNRIDLIKKERCELLKEVREEIQNGNEQVISNAEEIIQALNYDEKNIKKYDALKEAQGLIETLTVEILKANTKEERDILRKKLNYYINKVKNEAKKRNIDYSKYMEKVTEIRKNISKYVRLVKKEQQSYEIDELNYYYDTLTNEEKKILSRQISNARNYNTRVIREKKVNNVIVKNNDNNSYSPVIEPVEEISNTTSTECIEEPKEFTLDDIKKKNERSNSRAIITEDIPKRISKIDTSCLDNIEDHKNLKKNILSLQRVYKSDEDYISSRVSEFDTRYKLLRPMEYNKSFGKNFVTFVKNIPIYNINKKKIEKINKDYSLFHRGDDLGVYLDYIKMDNTVIAGLKKVLNNSALYDNENRYLSNHDRCVNWILSVVREKEINLSYRLAK